VKGGEEGELSVRPCFSLTSVVTNRSVITDAHTGKNGAIARLRAPPRARVSGGWGQILTATAEALIDEARFQR